MQRHIGDVAIDSVAPESAKFTASLLFVHGLWCTAAVWRKFMGYFAHRGWTSHALNLRGCAGSRTAVSMNALRFTDFLTDVRDVVAACDAPPVIIGHDLGGLLALATTAPARAIVALAPLVPHHFTYPALSPRTWLAALGTHPLPAPRGRTAAAYFGAGPPGGTTPASRAVARELARGEIVMPASRDVAAMVLAGAADSVSPPRQVERLAHEVGATFRCVEGATHAMPWEPQWEERVAEIHRWLIRTLGESLLLPREEEAE